MGNENSKLAAEQDTALLDQLCSLTSQDYPRSYRLSCDPFLTSSERDIPSSSADFPISSMIEEAEETQPLRPPSDSQGVSSSSSGVTRVEGQHLQKNQISNKLPKKMKKISKVSRSTKITKDSSPQNPQEGESNSNETAVEEGIRDQNNCKSYHKLVKNFLIEKGLGEVIEQYESKYHTRYYFIISLLIVKYRLPSEDFLSRYQAIVDAELAIQQRKIDRKAAELRVVKEKLQCVAAGSQNSLRAKESSLQSQMDHIRVVKFEIGDFSMRSCRAFFQGELQESLRILYLKNDPVMRKKYYFQEALEIVKGIQSEMRKNGSHR